MDGVVVKVVPARPDATRGERTLLADLVAAIAEVTKPGWHRLAVFTDKPKRAHWYRARLKTRCPDGYEFCATTHDGVGKVYCRRRRDGNKTPVGV